MTLGLITNVRTKRRREKSIVPMSKLYR